MRQLRGRNALLTGAAGGLGEFIAAALAAEGSNLVLSDLPGAPLADRIAKLREGGVTVEDVSADLADRSQAEALVGRAEEAIGPLDILVNNAGLEFGGPFDASTPGELEAITRVNLLAVMLLTRAALPGMRERGRGHVVNVASMAGKGAFPFLASYCATKHAVVGFTHSLRAEFGEDPVGFSAICPTFISDVGMYGRLEGEVGKPPALVTALPPDRVGEAVVKAIRGNRAEVLVSQTGTRVLIFLNALAPKTAARLTRRRPMMDFARRFAEARGRLQG
jgi:short-subunit dehydrogenase